jgi:hypothetical protein
MKDQTVPTRATPATLAARDRRVKRTGEKKFLALERLVLLGEEAERNQRIK